jgi:hypothetical protein
VGLLVGAEVRKLSMKTAVMFLGGVALLGCEYNVREEDPRESDDHWDSRSPSYEAPATLPPASEPKLPSTGSTDAGASPPPPAYECEGFATGCSELDPVSCGYQQGCTVSLDDVTCFGSPTPCSWLGTMSACGEQLGCSWTPIPR